MRGAVFRDDAILLVEEASDLGWSLPGGWADVGESPSEAVEREVLEESGYRTRAVKLIGLYERDRRADRPHVWHIWKAAFLCELVDDEQLPLGAETTAARFFARDELPQPSLLARLRVADRALLRAPRRPGPADGVRLMVTVDEVWEALAEIPDPEIPVISLVDLGVIKDVEVEDGHVRIEFTPTFMGCPALEPMKRRDGAEGRRARRRARGARRARRLLVDATASRREGREKLREAGFAPPSPRPVGKLDLVQLQTGAFRCPYCGSTDTRLENLFGPTPCRSIRYCDSCRQPFEQFKTL